MDKKLTAAVAAESSKQTRAMDLSRDKKRTAAATLVSSKPEAVALPLKRFRWMPEKRNPEDLWLSTFNVGIRWDDFDQTKEFNWNFKNLEAALKRGGKLYEKRLHLFGSTETQLLDIDGTVRIVHVPVVVVVDCPFTPLSTIGFTPLTLDGEDSYVRITYPLEPPMVSEFEWEMDDCGEFAYNVDLPENKKEKLKSLLKAVQERKRRAKEARKKAIDAMDPETKEAYENIIFYKFYPVKISDTPGVELKSKYIGEIGRNAFYRNAHHLM